MKFHISFFLILYIVFFKNTIKSETTTDESATGSLSSDGSRVTTQARIEKPKEQPALPTLAQETQPRQQQQQKEVGSGIGAEQKVESAKPGVEVSQSDVERAGRSSGTGGSVGTKISPGSQGQGKVAGPQLPQSFEQSRNQQSSPVTPKRNGISPTNAKSPESVLPPAQSFTNLNKSTIPHTIPIKSSFLKYYKGVKITGSCGVQFQLVIVPHLFIYVETKENNIQLEPRFMKLNERIDFEKDKSNLKNKCDVNKKQSFKFILYLQHDLITIKWKVYEEKPDTTTRIVDLNVDVKRYKLPKLDQPVISIQIHSLAQDGETYLMESKDYNLEDQIPEKCEAIASDCFLSGNVDIEKCLQCTLLVIKADKNDECLKYVSKNVKDRFEEILTKGEDDADSDEYDFIASANYILKNIYKKNDTNGKKELLHFKDINNNLKLELINYCNLLKDNDVSGILTYEKLGNVQDIFNNLTKLLEEHKEENNYVLYHKMKNEVLCLKNANDWMKNKTGLVLPQLKYSLNKFNKNKENYIKENIFEEDENGIVDLTKFPVDTSYSSYNYADSLYCNREYCNSWGKYWGDEGYFKVDMYGPPTCEDNFIHTVVVFNVEVPVNENFDKKEHDIYKSYLKNSPDFYHNIYYKNYNFENYVSPISTWSEVLHNTLYNNNLIWGQETTDPIGEGKLPASEAGHLRGEGKGNSEENQGQRSNANGAISSNQSTGGKITKQGESKDDGVALPVSTDGKPNTSSSVVDTNDQRSLPNPRATSLQPPSVQIPNHEGTSAPGNSRTPSIVSPTAAEKSRKAQIFHVLKHIKNSRIKMGLVKYDNSDNIGGDHVCSRTYAVNPEKQEECVKFCEENWENCKNKPSPGYCLAKLKNTNECFFCYV
ncbi:hypothetical protein PFBG_00656 [Plasmodium falciparum 7G8]|uniref:Serine repeat antigen 2 n=1 Tax=Plasmodium falciparum (isolate 7G8) TaxID=57266 RepID=W7F7A3_PLAF8|nr:hypothetical protein PFBG_00656 [Plasmodium falciparum 7G8]